MSFSTSVKIMRIACPAVLIAAVLSGSWAWSQCRYELVVIDAFLAGINVMLTWIQWGVFKI